MDPHLAALNSDIKPGRLDNLTFEEWLEHAFGHEVRLGRNPWYFDTNAPRWDPTATQALTYLTWLCEDPAGALDTFADSQIAQGLTYLFNTMATGDSGWFCSSTVLPQLRVRAVRSIYWLFEKLFLPKCASILSHLNEDGDCPLNRICYMWWDAFPSLALPNDPLRAAIHQAALETMQRTLRLDSIACQQAALHGLGHWHREYPTQVEDIVDGYLQSSHPARLDDYAKAARCGCVL
jgi:hypothetical protein